MFNEIACSIEMLILIYRWLNQCKVFRSEEALLQNINTVRRNYQQETTSVDAESAFTQ